ncbi:polysaccharide deacetylase family protein [Paludibacter jiangxiensis]|uniref:Polysaccharide deacetylase n=1 Tax=Paludibacter jiangxiensis TaxID=681398 RepID=A0A161L6J7_9BACT|nr:polysaccharide deacetylase family protein [Paludibacter jiangxiensis]GAT61444.1 polysaccharide deacetylase [Paludibacter jiangxiensis]
MRSRLLLLLIFVSVIAFGQKKHVCISIDDLPVVDYGPYDTVVQQRIMDNLIVSLKKNKVPAIGFVNENKLYNYVNKPMSFQIHLLDKWLGNGLMLGNHTFSHPDYNTESFKAFSHDILKGEIISKELLKKYGQKKKYFRHPYLHVGTTKARADSLASFLTEHGYTTAPITIDSEDYAFAYAYYKAKQKKDAALMKKIVSDYLVYIDQDIKHFEKESVGLFGRTMNQVILLHASMLNSEYMNDIIAIFRKNGYDFQPIDKVLKDPAYKIPVTVYGTFGSSWLDRWALSLNKRGDFLMGAPEPPEYVKRMLNE